MLTMSLMLTDYWNIPSPQVKIVQEAFTPSEVKRKWATDLMVAFEEHQKSGKGAFIFQEKMIDMPLLRQAQNIAAMCEKMKVS